MITGNHIYDIKFGHPTVMLFSYRGQEFIIEDWKLFMDMSQESISLRILGEAIDSYKVKYGEEK